jgi:hypothetical protein
MQIQEDSDGNVWAVNDTRGKRRGKRVSNVTSRDVKKQSYRPSKEHVHSRSPVPVPVPAQKSPQRQPLTTSPPSQTHLRAPKKHSASVNEIMQKVLQRTQSVSDPKKKVPHTQTHQANGNGDPRRELKTQSSRTLINQSIPQSNANVTASKVNLRHEISSKVQLAMENAQSSMNQNQNQNTHQVPPKVHKVNEATGLTRGELKKQASYKSQSVSERIKMFEKSPEQEKKNVVVAKSKVGQKEDVVSISDFKKRLKDSAGNRYALKKSPSLPVDGKKQSSIDMASIRKQIRAKEEAVSAAPKQGIERLSQQSSVTSQSLPGPSKIIPFSSNNLSPNSHEAKPKVVSRQDSFIPFTNDMMYANVHERKTSKDMTRTLIRQMSIDKMHEAEQQVVKMSVNNSVPKKTVRRGSVIQESTADVAAVAPPPPPPPPFLTDISNFKLTKSLKPTVTRDASIPLPPPPSETNVKAVDGPRSNKDKNQSFFRKQQLSNADKLQAEEARLSQMKPDERLKYEKEKELQALHDQRKSDHYAQLGKAFVVKDAGSGSAIGGPGGRGGRGAGRGGRGGSNRGSR